MLLAAAASNFGKSFSPSILHLFRNFHHQTLPSAFQLEYKPLPRSGNYVLDFRRDRQILEDGFMPANNSEIKIRLELLDENDIEFISQLVTEHFIKESNICRHLRVTGEELMELHFPLVTQWISCQNSILLKHDEKVVGSVLGSSHAAEEFEQLYQGQLFHAIPEFVIKSCYAEDIKNGPCKSLNVNRVAVLLSELSWQTGKFLPKNAKKIGLHELYAIHPNYMRLGLASKCSKTVRDLMMKQGCTHELTYCVATGTLRMNKNTRHQILFSFPYDRYLENGKPIFEKLHDGATAAHTVFIEYKHDNSVPKLF